jgi:NAD(P)-dependent dehydrogenase (short-subunit alcohol dehydrogenase family)
MADDTYNWRISMKMMNKTAIVTGAGSGIGRATAFRFAKEGVNVIVLDINEDTAKITADEIMNQGGSAMAVQSDIRDSVRIRQIVSDVLKRYGSVDILVNNAGGPAGFFRGMKSTRFIESTEEVWRMIIDINLFGTLIVTRAVLDAMVEKRKGKIVNVGSVAGVNGLANMADYSAAKGGVIAFTRTLAIELGEYNINVNCVSPGSVGKYSGGLLTGGPPTFLGRPGKPEEFASLIFFLASDESDFITGQNYIIDGGRVLSTNCQ